MKKILIAGLFAVAIAATADEAPIYVESLAQRLKLSGLLQVDSRTFFEDQVRPQANTIVPRRGRLLIDADLGPKAKLRFQTDLVTGLVVDAYGELKLLPWATLRAGLFKTPLSLERWRSDPARDFVELGYTTDMVTDRDTGAWLELADADQALFVGAGVFNGSVDNTAVVTADTDDDKDVVAKVFTHPFRFWTLPSLRNLGLGVAFSSGNRGFGTAPSAANQFRPTGQGSGFYALSTGTAVADGVQQRVVPQAYGYFGSLSFLGEYVRDSLVYRLPNLVTLSPIAVNNEAWQAQVGWVLTGEDSAFGGLKLNPASHPWGALQILGRLQSLNFDQESFYRYDAAGTAASSGPAQGKLVDPRVSPSSLQAWGVGLNYLPMNNVKCLLDWEETHYTDGAKTGTGTATRTANRETEKVLLARVQYSF
jgi:phosphate-selective porin OprO/OprP